MSEEPRVKKAKRYLALPVFIDPSDLLKELIDPAKVAGRDYLVVDVRDTDFEGGNIKDCVNIPSSRFTNDMDEIIAEIKHIPVLYFHCQLSQVRGPKSAQRYVSAINQSSANFNLQQVLIVRGGFEEFLGFVGPSNKTVLENIRYGY